MLYWRNNFLPFKSPPIHHTRPFLYHRTRATRFYSSKLLTIWHLAIFDVGLCFCSSMATWQVRNLSVQIVFFFRSYRWIKENVESFYQLATGLLFYSHRLERNAILVKSWIDNYFHVGWESIYMSVCHPASALVWWLMPTETMPWKTASLYYKETGRFKTCVL